MVVAQVNNASAGSADYAEKMSDTENGIVDSILVLTLCYINI